MTRRRVVIGVAAIAILLIGTAARPTVHGLTLVVRAADLHGVGRRLADLDTVRIRERLVDVPLRERSIRVRVYAPLGTARQTVLLVSGLHPAGIDEPRLTTLARRLRTQCASRVSAWIAEFA